MAKFAPKKQRKKNTPVQWIVKPRRTKVLSVTDKLLDSLDSFRSSLSLRRHGFILAVAGIFAGGIAVGVGIGGMSSSPPPAPVTETPVGSPSDGKAGSPSNFVPPQFLDAAMDEVMHTDEETFAEADPGQELENLDSGWHEPEKEPVAEEPRMKPAAPPPKAPAAAAKPRPVPGTGGEVRRNPELAALPPPPEPVAEEGMPPWRRYAVAAPKMDGRPRIALVIDDLGVDKHRSAAVTDLPGPLTTAFLSYATDLLAQTRAAHAAGHELIIHVPMEPRNPDTDPGPDALLVGRNETQIRNGLEQIFSRFPGYVGINNHMGSLFTANVRGMSVVLGELKKRGLLFLDSRTSNATVGPEIARRYGLPHAVRDVFIDNDNDVPHVRARLAELERVALQRGYAVGIGHPRDATVEALRGWLPSLQRKGFVLVPLSSIVRQRQEQTATVAAGPPRAP